MHHAVAPVGHQVGLGHAPAMHRLGPLRRSTQVEQVHARLDHRAVDDPGHDRGQVRGGDGDHRLVEPAHAAAGVARGQCGLTVPEQAQRQQVAIREPLRDGDDLLRQRAYAVA